MVEVAAVVDGLEEISTLTMMMTRMMILPPAITTTMTEVGATAAAVTVTTGMQVQQPVPSYRMLSL